MVGNRWLYELGLTGFWARALVMIPLVSVVGVAAGWAFHALVEARFLSRPIGFRSLAHAGRRLPSRSPPARHRPAHGGLTGPTGTGVMDSPGSAARSGRRSPASDVNGRPP